MDRLKDELSKKHEERTDKILTKPTPNIINKRTRCKNCTRIIYRGCIGCTKCVDWYHFGCAGFSKEKEATTPSKTYTCKTCKQRTNKQYPEAVRHRLWLQGLVEYEKDYDDTNPDVWFSDNHITYVFENIQKSLGETSVENQNFLFIKPTVVYSINTKDSKE